MLAACGSSPPPATLANSAVAGPPHVTAEGLRGFEDGQPITKPALEGWVAGADVLEYVPNYFVFLRHGVHLSREVLDDVVPAGAIGLIDYRGPQSPTMIVESAAITNPWGVQVGMTITELRQRIPGAVCDRTACEPPHSRFRFITTGDKVAWWVWHGSGRPRAAYHAPVDDWRFEAGGIGPIDGTVPATLATIAALAPGLVVTADGPDGFVLSRDGTPWVRLEARRGELVGMTATTPVLATRAGSRVGMSMRDAKAHEHYLACMRRLDDHGNTFAECDSRGVHLAFARHPASAAERQAAEDNTPVDEVALAGAPIEELHTEVY